VGGGNPYLGVAPVIQVVILDAEFAIM